MLRFGIIVLPAIHILLQRLRPRHVVDLRNIISVQLERTEELVESQAWVACYLCHSDRRDGGPEGTGNYDTGDVVNGNHVDRVVDVRARGQLDATLDHADEEVISVCCCVGGKRVSQLFISNV